MPAFNDLSGLRFGRLVAMSREPSAKANTRWRCICDCGAQCVIVGSHLRTGHTKSCGCFKSERTSQVHRRHGLTGTTTYYVWQHMVERCTDQRCAAYINYGARGIKVCDAWMNFENFVSEMGVRPPGMSLDRIDNSRGYELENCRWATRKQQANNMRSNVVLQLPDGKRLTLAQYCEMTGQPYHTVKSRRLRTGVISGVCEVRA